MDGKYTSENIYIDLEINRGETDFGRGVGITINAGKVYSKSIIVKNNTDFEFDVKVPGENWPEGKCFRIIYPLAVHPGPLILSTNDSIYKYT